jgi:hypothetical protein
MRHNFALEPRQIGVDSQNDKKQKRNLDEYDDQIGVCS